MSDIALDFGPLDPLNAVALAFFLVCWLFYQPLLAAMGQGGGAVINADLTVLRVAWMRNMARRENRMMDGQLLGQTLSSSSFFASSNLLLIAACSGALFGGQAFQHVASLGVVKTSSRLLFEGQLALVVMTLARGLLDFIWAIRQLNYALAAVGATPPHVDNATSRAFGELVGRLLNPALSSFSSGVRGYYFALAAAAWLFGPIPFIAATLGAMGLMIWRQRSSPAAAAIAELRRLIETYAPTEGS